MQFLTKEETPSRKVNSYPIDNIYVLVTESGNNSRYGFNHPHNDEDKMMQVISAVEIKGNIDFSIQIQEIMLKLEESYDRASLKNIFNREYLKSHGEKLNNTWGLQMCIGQCNKFIVELYCPVCNMTIVLGYCI